MSYHAQLGEAVRLLFPSAAPGVNYSVQSDGAAPFIARWGLPNPQPTEAEIEAAVLLIPAAVLAAKQQAAKDALDGDSLNGRQLRALITLLVSELNLLRSWIMAFKAATAAAASLADLKTRVAALADTADRTKPQVITAIKAAVDGEN